MSSLGLVGDGSLRSSSAPPMKATTAKIRFTYSVHRQDRYSVSAPPSSSPTALLRLGECGGQQRQRRRHQQRGEHALASPRGHQHGEVDRSAPHGRNTREAGQAGQERFLPAQQVSQPAAEQQQAAERQRVRGDHPLPVYLGEVQGLLDRRQRDVHHRKVQDHHQLRQADHAQDQPALPPQAASHGGGISHENHHFFHWYYGRRAVRAR